MPDDPQKPKPWEKYKQQAKPWEKYGSAAPAATPTQEFKLMSEKAPENARFPSLGPTGYHLLDELAKSLPAVGATTGAAVASPAGGIPAVGGAGLGAMAGDRAQRMLYQAIYKDIPPETLKQAGISMGQQGILGASTESGAQVANRFVFEPLISKFQLAREVARDARAGEGIRLTPGEAGDSAGLKRAESVLEHWPGSSGTMEKFRAEQTQDIYRSVEQQLDAISKENLTPEEAGKRIQSVLTKAKEQLDPTIQAGVEKIDTAEQQHTQGLLNKRLTDLSPNQVTNEELGQTVQQNVTAGKQQVDATVDRDLTRIRQQQQQNIDQLFNGQLDALHPSPVPRQQIGEAIQQDLRAAKEQTDQAAQRQITDIRQRQQQDVMTVLDTQANKLSPRPRPREETGKAIQVDIQAKQAGADQAIDDKFNEVRRLVGQKPDEYLTPTELDNLVEQKPEARSKLEEARLLFQQRDARFAPPIIQKILKTTKPEDIGDVIANASLDDLQLIKATLPPALQQAAAREVYEGMIRQATDPRTGVVSARSFASQLKDLGPERGEILFGDQYPAIAEAANKRIDAINTAADASVDSITQQAKAKYAPDLVQKVLKTNKPEDIATAFQNAGAGELQAFKTTLPPEQQAEASRAVLENIIEKARDPQTGVVSAAKLAKSLRDLGEERGRILFGDQYDKIFRSSQTFNSINEAAEQSAAQVQSRAAQYSQDLYAKILKTNKPETITTLVQNAGLEELRQLKAQLPPEAQANLSRNVYESILEKARDPQTGVVDAKKLAKGLRDLGPERGRILFGDQYENVANSSQILTRISDAAEAQRKTVLAKGGRFTADLIQRVIQSDRPEAIGALMRNAGLDELRTFRTELSPQMQQTAARNVLEDIIRPGREIGTGTLNPADLSRALNKGLKDLGPGRGAIIFGDQYQNIVEAAELLDRIGKNESPIAGQMHMAKFLGTLSTSMFGGTLALGLVTGHPAEAVGVMTAEFLGPKMLSFMLTHPAFSSVTLKGLRWMTFAIARGIPLALDERFQTSPARYPIPHLEAPAP
jgi:hypothetical protein